MMTERKWSIFWRWAAVERPHFSKLEAIDSSTTARFHELVDDLMKTCDLDATEANLNAGKLELVPLK